MFVKERELTGGAMPLPYNQSYSCCLIHKLIQNKEVIAMTEEQFPHKLTLNERKSLTMSGVTEVVSFEETAVVLKTSLGLLTVQGQELKLKTLSLEGGQMEVDGEVSALIYEQPRTEGFWQRLWQ